MTNLKLGIGAGFATNRFPEPGVWTRIVKEQLGLRYVQFVVDLLSPFLPRTLVSREIKKIRQCAERHDIKIDTTFGSTFSRINLLMHPDALQRKAWFNWFERWLQISSDLGARGCGLHFGIMSVRDFDNEKRRKFLIQEAITSWRRLAHFGAKLDLQFLMFEPMSIAREIPCTIDSTKELLERVNEGKLPIPVKLCLDVDHGDTSSSDPRDGDPYAWLRELAQFAPVVHIKQSTENKGGHWAFTEEHNKRGIITPPKVIEAINASGAEDVVLSFEISHRERYPTENRVIDDLKESVEYWRPYVRQ